MCCACTSLTGVDASPESGLWYTQRGVPATPRSESWDELDLGKLRVFTPEELGGRDETKEEKWGWKLVQDINTSLIPGP